MKDTFRIYPNEAYFELLRVFHAEARANSQRTPPGPADFVIFMGFDGVLHPDQLFDEPNGSRVLYGPSGARLFQAADALAQRLSHFRKLKVVLTSHWVSDFGYPVARCCVPESLRKYVVDATRSEDVDGWYWASLGRFGQIENYVRRHSVGSWVAIDDWIDGWPRQARQFLVRTNPAGLDEQTLALLERKIAQRLRMSRPLAAAM